MSSYVNSKILLKTRPPSKQRRSRVAHLEFNSPSAKFDSIDAIFEQYDHAKIGALTDISD